MFEYNICYSLDSKYAEQLAVSITSILKNAEENETINFYILDGGLTQQDKLNVEKLKSIKDFKIDYIQINNSEFEDCPLLKEKDELYFDYHVTLPTYFRFKLPTLLDNISTVLYMDCDVIVRTSLKELFAENLSDCAVKMVLDVESEKEAKRLAINSYYNAGVMLINLDYWRKNKIEKRLFDYAKNNQENILWQDQDIINCVLKDEILPIDLKWNYQYFLYDKVENNDLSGCYCLHLSGRFKPWLMSFEHPVYDEYYYYLSFTKWRNNIIEYKRLCGGKYLKDNIGGSVTNIRLNATKEDLYEYTNKNYDYSDEIKEFLLEEIEKSYAFVKKLVNDTDIHSRIKTDAKVEHIYEEITRCYKYTEKLVDEVKTILSSDLEGKNSFFVEEVDKLKKTIVSSEEKIGYNIKIETDKIYKHLWNKFNEVKKDVLAASTLAEAISEDLDISVSNLKKEVRAFINEYEKVVRLGEFIEGTNNTVSNPMQIYSYVNEQNLKIVSDFHTLVGENHKNLEAKIEYLSDNLNDVSNNNSLLASKVVSKLDKDELSNSISYFEQKLRQVEINYQKKLDFIEKQFEKNLVTQRLKYEEKLYALEQKLESICFSDEEKRDSLIVNLKNRLKRD